MNNGGAAGYGSDKAIFAYGGKATIGGFWNEKTLISNTGSVGADQSGVGTPRIATAAASYDTDKAIFAFGYITGDSSTSVSNLVSNIGVVATDTAGVGTARWALMAASYN
jgi:hypothetical protein